MKTTLRSNDLSCPSCIAKIESTLGYIGGVERAEVHFNSGRIVVEHDENRVDVKKLQETVRGLGYETKESPL